MWNLWSNRDISIHVNSHSLWTLENNIRQQKLCLFLAETFWLFKKKMVVAHVAHYVPSLHNVLCQCQTSMCYFSLLQSCYHLWWDQAGIYIYNLIPLLHTHLLAPASLVPALWLSCCMLLSLSIPMLQLKAQWSAVGSTLGRVALEWRKQRGSSSIGWKIRSLPCNSAAGADIIRLQSAIRQVIPPTDCNR